MPQQQIFAQFINFHLADPCYALLNPMLFISVLHPNVITLMNFGLQLWLQIKLKFSFLFGYQFASDLAELIIRKIFTYT